MGNGAPATTRAMFAAAGAVACLTLAGCTASTTGHPSLVRAPTTQSAPTTVAVTSDAAHYTNPLPLDFTVTIKVLSKQCFGQAGCDLTYRPELSTSLPSSVINPSITYDVTYEVDGSSDGPQTDTMEVTGGQYRSAGVQVAQTDSAAVVLTARVTSVSPAS